MSFDSLYIKVLNTIELVAKCRWLSWRSVACWKLDPISVQLPIKSVRFCFIHSNIWNKYTEGKISNVEPLPAITLMKTGDNVGFCKKDISIWLWAQFLVLNFSSSNSCKHDTAISIRPQISSRFLQRWMLSTRKNSLKWGCRSPKWKNVDKFNQINNNQKVNLWTIDYPARMYLAGSIGQDVIA